MPAPRNPSKKQAQQAAASPLPAQRSQLMATALLFLSPRAAAEMLAQRKGGTP